MRGAIPWLALVQAFSPAMEGAVPAVTLVPAEFAGDGKLKAIALAMEKGYGKEFGGVKKNAGGATVFMLAGVELIYDDGKEKTFAELLDSPDLEDSFKLVYPRENPVDKLEKDFDPGRFRVEGMFKALYGNTAEEVASHCVNVPFCGRQVRFSARCGAADALEAVGRELEAVFAAKPALKEYVADLGGTFQWRFIAGTTRLSNHSFGNAIDLSVKKSAYWKWAPEATLATFSRKDWPAEIVAVFEKHGFIWGGKWWHYDTMHFEFRPELIEFSKAAG